MGTFVFSGGNGTYGFSMLDWSFADILNIVSSTFSSSRSSTHVTYVAGGATAGEIDPRVKQAVLLMIGHWYENREAVLTGTISKEVEHAVQALMFQMWDGRLT